MSLKKKKTNKKNSKFVEEVMQVLAESYDNNILNYSLAEQEVKNKYLLIDKLHNIELKKPPKALISTNVTDGSNSVVCMDIQKDEISIGETNTPNALLAYSLDYLSVRRILPFGLTTFLDSMKSKDLSNAKLNKDIKTKEHTLDILQWVKNRVLNNYYIVNSISLNRPNGVLNFNTSFRDMEYTNCQQYITVKLDAERFMAINAEKRKIKDWANDYVSLFGYFMMIGMSQIFSRCTCMDYVRNNGKRMGSAIYVCPHIMYSLANLPYYAYYALR